MFIKIKKLYNKIIFYITKTNLLYTIYFNFRYLPYNQAKYIPILIYPKTKISITNKGKIKLGDIFNKKTSKKLHIGYTDDDFGYGNEITTIKIIGTFNAKGKMLVLPGVKLDIRGVLETGDDIIIGARTRVSAYCKIEIGEGSRIAHESQIFDTNFHYIVDLNNREYRPMSKPIYIGNYCWIGNRTTVNSGTYLPDYTIVASNSLVNKDFHNINNYTLLGGTPCKVIKEGIVRVFDPLLEIEYKKKEFKWYNK